MNDVNTFPFFKWRGEYAISFLLKYTEPINHKNQFLVIIYDSIMAARLLESCSIGNYFRMRYVVY